MKSVLFTVIVTAAFFMVGCSNQSSPVSHPTTSFVQSDAAQAELSFSVDAIVVDAESGVEYHVTGTIECLFIRGGGSYTLIRQPELFVFGPTKALVASISEEVQSKGTWEGEEPIAISDAFSLESLDPSLVLHVGYFVSNVVVLGDISIDKAQIGIADGE